MPSVTCSSCSETSTTVDPILDIQLDFSAHNAQELTLAGMLRRYCSEERVGVERGYDCSQCGGGLGVVCRPSTMDAAHSWSDRHEEAINQESCLLSSHSS